MLCRDIMRQPVRSCEPRHTTEAVAIQMRDAGIGFLPVCDQSNRVLGVVTDRDLAVRVCANGLSAKTTPVSQIMTRELVECRPDDDLQRAQELMATRHKSRIVVTDAHGKLVGIISLADLAQLDAKLAAATLSEVSAREVLDPYGRVSAHV